MENTTKNSFAEVLDRIQPLNRDLVETAATLTASEVRYLVDAYYEIHGSRNAASQVRPSPHSVIAWFFEQNEKLGEQIERALDFWTGSVPAAVWAKGIAGIGPVIAAGLAAHIDISKCPTVGRIWRFAGLDPTVQWQTDTKRPWNAALKSLCWTIGESFVKVSGREGDFYGKLYLQRKAAEHARNEAGEFADQAKAQLARAGSGRDGGDERWYAEGKLPPAHIRSRAKRWAVKLFLAHYHHVAWRLATGQEPPKPYVIAHLDHVDCITPPNFHPVSESLSAGERRASR
jgi:hypothetical protein